MKNVLHILLYFLLLLAYCVGVIGGIVSLLCLGYWPIALCIAFVGYMAIPKAEEYFHKMIQ